MARRSVDAVGSRHFHTLRRFLEAAVDGDEANQRTI